MRKYNHLVFAGTFDRLHVGHKKMLDLAFGLAEKVSIGITTEKLYHSKPLANLILTLEVRKGAVEQYVRERKWQKRARFFMIEDIYGSSITDKTMDSILVTELTKKNAEKINEIRINPTSSRRDVGTTLGVGKLKPLKIIVAPMVRGDDGEAVTSERIRMGEIDRNGRNYQFLISNYSNQTPNSNDKKQKLILPRKMRKELRKPLGVVIKGPLDQLEATARKLLYYNIIMESTMVISVGDVVTESLFKIGIEPDIKIIDFRSRRQKIFNSQFTIFNKSDKFENLVNEPGTINLKTAEEIKSVIRSFIEKPNFATHFAKATRVKKASRGGGKKSWIVVKGEEDLLALPAILFAPLHSVVLYGQMDLGIVMVEVTEEKKREVEEILRKFK